MTAGLQWPPDTNTLSALMRRPVSPDLLQRLATAGDEAVCTSMFERVPGLVVEDWLVA